MTQNDGSIIDQSNWQRIFLLLLLHELDILKWNVKNIFKMFEKKKKYIYNCSILE